MQTSGRERMPEIRGSNEIDRRRANMFARKIRLFVSVLLLTLCLASAAALAEMEDYAGIWTPVSELGATLEDAQVHIELRTDGSGSVFRDGEEYLSIRWSLNGFTCDNDNWSLYYDGRFLCLDYEYVWFPYAFQRVKDARGQDVRPDYSDSSFRGYWYGRSNGAAIHVALKGDGSGWIDMGSSYATLHTQLTWQSDPSGVRVWAPDLTSMGAENLMLYQDEDWLVEQNRLRMEVGGDSVELGKIAEFDAEERFLWSDNKDGTCMLRGILDDTAEELVLPEKIEGRELCHINGTLSTTTPALKRIQIPDCAQSIDDGAFRSFPALERVVIPREVTSISDNLFAGESSPVIITTSGSEAQAYAERNNLACLAVDQIFYAEKRDQRLIRMELFADGSVELSEGSHLKMDSSQTLRWRFHPNGWTIYEQQLLGKEKEIATVEYGDDTLWLIFNGEEGETEACSLFVSDRMERFLDCCQRVKSDAVEDILGVWVPEKQPEGRYLTVSISSRGFVSLEEYYLQGKTDTSNLEWYPTEAGIELEKDGAQVMTVAPPEDGKLCAEFLDWGALEFVRIKAGEAYLSADELEELFHFKQIRTAEQRKACQGVWKSSSLDNFDFVYLYLFLAEDGTGAYRYEDATLHPLTWEPTDEGFRITPVVGLKKLGLKAGEPENIKFSEFAQDRANWRSDYNGIVSLSREETEWTAPQQSDALEGVSYELREDGCAVLTGYSGSEEVLCLPSQMDGHTLAGIGNSAFRQNHALKSVEIPGSVEFIGEEAFANCSNLEKLTLSAGLQSIGRNAFLDCWQIERLSIPEGVREIGAYAFQGCYNLKELSIPGSVEVIGNCAFESCPQLEKLQLNEGLKVIGDWAFCGDKSLEELVIPEGVTTLGEGAFSSCSALWKVVLPESLTTIGSTFDSCAPTITLWAKAGSEAWNWAQDYGIPVKEIGAEEALASGDNSGTEDDTQSEQANTATRLDAFNWGDNGDGTARVERYLSTEDVVRVPEDVSGAAVTSIETEAFARSGVKEVYLPEGVSDIGDRAFFECAGLQTVVLPASLQSVGKFAFNNCPNLVLQVPAGSWAESYAAGKKLKYEVYQ